ncbi:hypothetical protein KDW_38880 [Dictyobacter vulcani]|uniref:GIY-YIG domain-containing protein n=1 Tax=Dictyobacter vulcani TaxID=2607529 RepID=A0A5J4KWZ7_9CHLR|nr:hypothetical protein KDW_38880 [Dictyobacter vulcani]
MGLPWSQAYSLDSPNLQNIASSPGSYKVLNEDNGQLLFVGTSTDIRSRFQAHMRKNWHCPNPVFSFASLSSDLLPHQFAEIENDLLGSYYAQAHTLPAFQFSGQ